jgi:hypothetical protein
VHVSGYIIPVCIAATASTLNILRVVWLQEDFHCLSSLDDSVTPSIGHVERYPWLTIGVYVAVAAVHDPVRSTVLVVELSIRSHFISELVRT